MAEAKAARSSVPPPAQAGAVGSAAGGRPPDADPDERAAQATPALSDDVDEEWPGPIDEPPPLFAE